MASPRASVEPKAAPTAEDFAREFPEAAAFAKAMRDAFGDGVKVIYARNQQGREIRLKRRLT